MNREILFRGKRLQGENWVEGYFYKSDINKRERESGKATLIFTPDCDTFIYIPKALNSVMVIAETVGQYTGLTDKNGKKIFVGDILRVEQRGETGSKTCPVYFGEYIDADSVFDDYRCIGFYIKTSDGCGNIGFLLDSEFECEVIGNTFDSPELLEGE